MHLLLFVVIFMDSFFDLMKLFEVGGDPQQRDISSLEIMLIEDTSVLRCLCWDKFLTMNFYRLKVTDCTKVLITCY
ncbi:unnamed protein product [Heterobilharzia americana]|nr:unnamed protein product [Heterobilharzia americana]